MANEQPAHSVSDKYYQDRFTNGNSACAVGRYAGAGEDGALRFINIDIDKDQSLDACYLYLKYGDCGSSGGTWKWNLVGIDEDNTGSFGYPFSRPQTSAVNAYNEGAPTSGGSKLMDVKSIVAEITSRSGWSNGNALGFLLFENGSSDDTWTTADDANCYLIYRYSAEPNFTPTPITVAAPTFPAADDYGIKISKPGYEVLTATRSQLLFTTREDVFKIQAEAQVAMTGSVEKLIAHGLAYKPECLVYLRKNGLSFELPRLFGDKTDPVGSGAMGYYSVDSTYLRINTSTDADVYYYILLDEQAT